VPDITNEYFSKLIQVIQNRLFDYDYPVAIYNTNESKFTEEKCLRYLSSQSVSGVIYINGNEDLEEDLLNNIPTIYVDREPSGHPRPRTKYVSSDNRNGGRLATKALLDSGCKKIAVMTERSGTYVMTERLLGYTQALKEAGIETDKSLIFRPEAITYDAAIAKIEEKLAEGISFDGIFCQTDWLASGALTAFQKHGLRVPEDVKVVGFDNISISYLCYQPFTTIQQDIGAIGNYLADTMIDMIDDNDHEESVRFFPVSLIRRQTT
jgi:LacI family transcriptional regulator